MPNSLTIMQMSLSILLQVYTHSPNMNSLVTKSRILYLGLQKCTSHFHVSLTISNFFFGLMEIATAYLANPVKLLKAPITMDSSRQQQDAPSNNCNQSDNIGQSSKVISMDAKHGNKVQNKWYVHWGMDVIDTHTHIPPQASRTFWCPSTLQPLFEEAGLAGVAWVSLRPQWWALAVLWLCAKVILSKATQSNLSLDETCLSDILNAWKD